MRAAPDRGKAVQCAQRPSHRSSIALPDNVQVETCDHRTQPIKELPMTRVDEIAADIFRISTYIADFNLQFNQFLIRDDEPLLFETGMKQIFPLIREAVSRVIDPATLRYLSF